jgi:hypothetical protein
MASLHATLLRTHAALAHTLLLFVLLAAPVRGASAAGDAARLEGDLTPVGAERAGNAAGTIPAWTGGISAPPADYRPGKWHTDPYAADEIAFTIDATNLRQHGDELTDGQLALLRTFPASWRMNVYPSRRSAAFPDWVYEAIRRNATQAQLVTRGKGGVTGARIGAPFPLPANGLEVIWNHLLRWRGVRVRFSQGVAAVTRRGNYRLVLSLQDLAFPYGAREDSVFHDRYPNVMLAIKSKTIAPALLAGDGTLVIEPIDQTDAPRKAWLYSQAIRRVVRSPHFAYDFPRSNSDNLATTDDVFLFNGPPDRFDWKLLGKREIYVPYNAYRMHGDAAGPDDILGPRHIEPRLARYELHRVWVVEATLRPGEQHVYSRRVFYLDEDSWRAILSESYDLNGKLWRVAEAHTVNHYEVPVLLETLTVFNDLKERRYFAAGLDNGRTPPRFQDDIHPREFSPNALLYYIR